MDPYYFQLFGWLKSWVLSTCRTQRYWLQEKKQQHTDESSLHHINALEQAYHQIEIAAQQPQVSFGDLDAWLHRVARTQEKLERFLQSSYRKQAPQSSKISKAQDAPDSANKEANIQQRVPIGKHQLPPLPYPYNALEPYIDEQTMRLHHDEHHKKYVDDLNKAEKNMEEARKTGNYQLIKHWEREAAFNGAGHYLHTLFWETMKPNGGGQPPNPLATEIKQDFGSFAAFQQHFSEAAEKVEGGGWAILVWSPRAQRLEILQAEKHQNLSQWDVIPLLPLDVWEHAYYLKYPNRRKEYIKNWWNTVNWNIVNQRFQIAHQVKWQPF